MKTKLAILIGLAFAEATLAQNSHKRECIEVLKNFSFSDRYGGCDEASDGRWFLHFEPGGSIRVGLWSTEKSRTLKYHFDDENTPYVDVSDIFDGTPKWRRVGPFTIEITNTDNIFIFTIVPNYEVGDPKFATNHIIFFEVGGQGRVFELGFDPEYEGKFKASKDYR